MDDPEELGLCPTPNTPVVSYANALLMSIMTREARSIALVESRGLPPMPTPQADDSSVPVDFAHVVNRLKIMVELDPVSYKQPVHGRMIILKDDVEYTIRMDFDDRPPDSSCVLTVEEVGSVDPNLKITH